MEEWKDLESVKDEEDVYRLLAERYILEKTKLDRIDKRIKEYEIPFIPVPEEDRDRRQSSSFMQMDYIYMRNDIHMERLTQEQIAVLRDAREHLAEETAVVQAMILVQETYREVLAFSETPDVNVELFPSISGEGNVPGDAVVFVIATVPDYDGYGNIKDWEKERRKSNVLFSLKAQLEPICEKALQMPVRFMII